MRPGWEGETLAVATATTLLPLAPALAHGTCIVWCMVVGVMGRM